MVVVIEQLYSAEDRRRAVHYPFATHRQQMPQQNKSKRVRRGETASQQADRAILGADAEGQGLGVEDGGSGGAGLKDRDLFGLDLGGSGGGVGVAAAAGEINDDTDVDVSSLDHKRRLERWQKQSHSHSGARLDSSLQLPFEHATHPIKTDDYYIKDEDDEDDNLSSLSLSLQLNKSTSSNAGNTSSITRNPPID